MKRIIRWISLAGLALSLIACGPPEPVIEQPAAEINLTTEDLGEPFVLKEEANFEELQEMLKLEEPRTAQDGHMRIFTSSHSQVIVTVLTFDSAKNAQNGLRDVRENLEAALQETFPQLLLEDRNAPKIGDEVVFAGAEISEQESPSQLYLFGFRSYNLIGFIVATGSSDALSEAQVRELGQELFQRVPAAQEP